MACRHINLPDCSFVLDVPPNSKKEKKDEEEKGEEDDDNELDLERKREMQTWAPLREDNGIGLANILTLKAR